MNAARPPTAAAIQIRRPGGARSERATAAPTSSTSSPTSSAKPTIPVSASVSRYIEWASRTKTAERRVARPPELERAGADARPWLGRVGVQRRLPDLVAPVAVGRPQAAEHVLLAGAAPTVPTGALNSCQRSSTQPGAPAATPNDARDREHGEPPHRRPPVGPGAATAGAADGVRRGRSRPAAARRQRRRSAASQMSSEPWLLRRRRRHTVLHGVALRRRESRIAEPGPATSSVPSASQPAGHEREEDDEPDDERDRAAARDRQVDAQRATAAAPPRRPPARQASVRPARRRAAAARPSRRTPPGRSSSSADS